MSNLSKGLLLFNNWLEAMKNINAQDFKRLIYAMYDYRTKGVRPPEFEGKAKIAAEIIFPMLKERMELSEYGSMGAEKRLSVSKGGKKAASGEKGEASSPLESSEASPPQAQEENRIEENKIEENRIEEKRSVYSPPRRRTEGDYARRARGTRQERVESEEEKARWDEFYNAAVEHAMREAERICGKAREKEGEQGEKQP